MARVLRDRRNIKAANDRKHSHTKGSILMDGKFMDNPFICNVSVRFPRSDGVMECLIMSTIDSGHHGALYGGQEGSKEAVLVG